jgi:amino acid adenylation domain-containing protein
MAGRTIETPAPVFTETAFFHLPGLLQVLPSGIPTDREECMTPDKPPSTHPDQSFPTDLWRSMIAMLAASRKIDDPPFKPTEPIATGIKFPLSPAQERLFFLHALTPTSSVYNEYLAVSCHGPLSRQTLQKALAAVVARQEALRTRISLMDGQPVQEILPPFSPEPEWFNLEPLEPTRRSSKAATIVNAAVAEPFILSAGPPLRIKLIRLSRYEHIFLMITHHIIFDESSFDLFCRELSHFYTAFHHREAARLPELRLSFKEAALRQRQSINASDQREHLDYYRKRFAQGKLVLDLPTDFPRPAAMHHVGAVRRFQIHSGLTRRLRHLAQEEGATLFMVLLAVFKVLLMRYTGRHDITVGTPVAERHRRDEKDIIGFFVNTLALRTFLSPAHSFRNVLRLVKKTCLAAYRRQPLPFHCLVAELCPERRRDVTPLIQVMFTLQKPRLDQLCLPDLRIHPFEVDRKSSKFDLTLILAETDNGFKGEWEYSTDLFSKATIERLNTHFSCLLEGVFAESNCSVGELPLLSPDEYRLCVDNWSHTQSAEMPRHTIHQLFEAEAANRPERVALRDGEDFLTYAALNRRAERLSGRLQATGVKPSTFVGIFLPRSIDWMVAALAILKSGAAYVPLSLEDPAPRRNQIIQDATIKLVVTTQAMAPSLSPTTIRILIDASEKELIFAPYRKPVVFPEHPAYCMYTSGTTGRPKGVVIPHRGVVRLVKKQCYADLGGNQVFLQLAPLAFDAATFEIWAPLLNGGVLALFGATIITPEAIIAAVQRHQVTTLWLTTDLFLQFSPQQLEALTSLQQLLTGGDLLPTPALQAAARHLPNCRLLACYGPTENTTFSTVFPVTPDNLKGHGTTPIGRPIRGTSVYVLDANHQPVPIGVTGELYLGGDGLALGYQGQPEATTAAFISHPFNDTQGARLYRTGDLVKWLPDGNLFFCGRRDRQIKIRGYRIEPEEIESTICRHPDIRACAVMATDTRQHVKVLSAYIECCQKDVKLSPERICRHIAMSLPAYLVPSQFFVVEQMPMTSNGKIDRKILKSIPARPVLHEAVRTVPSTLIEEMVARIWAESLGIESDHRGHSEINVNANFFESGGDSLQAIRFIANVQGVFAIDLPLETIFQSPTIKGLANHLAHRISYNMLQTLPGGNDAGLLVAIKPGGDLPPLFIVPGGGGTEFELLHYPKVAYLLAPDRPVFGFQARQLKQGPTALAKMSTEFVDALMERQPQGPYYLLGDCIGGVVAHEMARILSARGERIERLILIDTHMPSIGNYMIYCYQQLLLKYCSVPKRIFGFTMAVLRKVRNFRGFVCDYRQEGAFGRLDQIRCRFQTAVQNYCQATIPSDYVENPMIRFMKMTLRHGLKTYDGEIIMLLTEDCRSPWFARPWVQKYGKRLTILPLEGDHYSYLGRHYRHTAQTLRSLLRP